MEVRLVTKSELLERLAWNVSERPDEISLLEVDYKGETRRRELTWRQFMLRVEAVSGWLAAQGIQPGDRVALVLENCLEWLPIYFAVLNSSAVAVPLNYRASPTEIVQCSARAGVRVVIAAANLVQQLRDVPDYRLDVVSCDDAMDRDASLVGRGADSMLPKASDDAAVYFSSGTTGRPKAIVHTHASLMAGARCEASHHSLTSQDRFLCIPPLYHAGAKIHWFGSLITGGSCVLLKSHDAMSVARAIKDEDVTVMWTLGPWARDLIDQVDAGVLAISRSEYGSLRLTHMGAQPIPRDLIDRWRAIWDWCEYDTDYGLTEAGGPGCMHLGVRNSVKAGSIGLPGDGWQAKIVDNEDNELPPGEIGELTLKGPGVMRGYLEDLSATQLVLNNGWLRTGDLAYVDDDRFAWLVDRKNDLIIVGGENVYPSEVEELIRGLPGVRDVAACGIYDLRLGEIVGLTVESGDAGPSIEAVQELCEKRLPWYKRPRLIQFGVVPRNNTGKIDRGKVRANLVPQPQPKM